MQHSLLSVPTCLTAKGDRAEFLYSPLNNADVVTYDCAVPQSWVDAMTRRGFDNPASHVVTCYLKGGMTCIMPITDYGLRILSTVATYEA